MKKVVVLGGGTGNFVVLRGLKNYDVQLSAIVSMADDGGSTGILRDELGVLPPGDVRQCLVALSDSSRLMRSLMSYRFERGGLEGHSFGNILLSALEKVTGSFESAIEEAGRILNIKGKVIPVTTNKVRLKMVLNDDTVLDGEGEVCTSRILDIGYKGIYLEPLPKADVHALEAIRHADLIIVGPGGLYSSLIPSLLVEGVREALCESKARKVFVVNLMNKIGQTTCYKVSDHLREIVSFVGRDIFDHIIVNGGVPVQDLLERYEKEAALVTNDLDDARILFANLLEDGMSARDPHDVLARHRTLIRHDAHKLAKVLMGIVEKI